MDVLAEMSCFRVIVALLLLFCCCCRLVAVGGGLAVVFVAVAVASSDKLWPMLVTITAMILMAR